MCRETTPIEKQEKCGRCGNIANPDDGWEHGWPLHGVIDIGFPSQAFGALCGMKHIADPHHFLWWDEGHPAMTKNEAQHVRFEWDHKKPWRLCYKCQEELLKVIGEFFKIPARAEELRKSEKGVQQQQEITARMQDLAKYFFQQNA